MRPRFTIAALVAIIASLGVGFAALRSPSQLWASTLFTLTLAALAVALVNAIYGRDRRRAFWTGFLVFGGPYALLALGPWLAEGVGSRLVTTAFLDVLYPKLIAQTPASGGGMGGMGGGMQGMGGGFTMSGGMGGMGGPPFTIQSRWATWTEPNGANFSPVQVGHINLLSPETYRRIGHCLFTLLFAALGGLYAGRRFAGGATATPPS